MKKLTELAIKRPLLITVAFVALILFGLISFKQLNYNLLPKFDANVVMVLTTYRGASAEEIENSVTRNIEDAVSALEGVDRIMSSSREGVSNVIIQLKEGADVNYALNDAQRKVNQVASLLPTGIDQPILSKFSSDDIPVLRLATTAKLSPAALYDLMDKQIKPQISNIEGVGQVTLIGGNERQINVNVDKDKLEAYGLTITQVSQIINASSLSTPAGTVETPRNLFSIKFDAKFTEPEDMRNMVIRQNANGSKIYLKDIAEVVDAQTDITTINHFNGKPSLGVQVQKQSDANAVEVSKLVRERLKKVEEQYKNIDLKFDVASDQSVYTLDSSAAVMHDLILAVFIVAIVMLFFLHSFRSAMFVMVALPSSMIPVFIFMNLFGMSLNLMTLMGLSLVVGILVDDSIVILENIMRHMEMGKNKVKATVDGRSEIGFTAIAITLVDVVVFLPVALSGGIIGLILREFALVVVSSTLMSLLVCFTITPLLASHFGRIVHLSKKSWWGKANIWFENQLTSIREGYANILRWSLGHKRWILGGAFVLFFSSFLLLANGFIGTSFMSKSDRGEINIKLEMAPQTAVYENNKIVQRVEKMLFEQPEVVSVFSNVGYNSSAGFVLPGMSGNNNYSELTVTMVDKEERKVSDDEFGLRMRRLISEIPGVKVTVTPVGITGNSQIDVQLVVKGSKREDVRKTANMLKDVVEKTAGTQYVKFSADDPKPEVEVKLNREKITNYGLNAAEVGTAIAYAFSGNNTAKFKSSGNEYDIMVTSDKFDKTSIDNVRRLQFVNAQGQVFQMSQFADINETMGETVMERMDRLPSLTINASVVGRSVGTVGSEITEQINKMQLPAGTSWHYIGTLENQTESFVSLLLALGLGIVLVYLIMVALYENAVYPLVVLFALPMAMIGAFLGLSLSMQDMTIFAMVGIIMLMGLVAKNGILLVDFTNHRKAEGAPLVEALIDAGRERFRPIIMTTLAMISGMMPIALASGAGAEVKNGMAWVIIGGLTSSLLLTLVVVPCMYYIIDTLQHKLTRRKRVRFFKKTRSLIELKHA